MSEFSDWKVGEFVGFGGRGSWGWVGFDRQIAIPYEHSSKPLFQFHAIGYKDAMLKKSKVLTNVFRNVQQL